MRGGALSEDYRQNAYYDIRGILEEVSRQVLEAPRTRRRLEEMRGRAADNGDHAPVPFSRNVIINPQLVPA